MTNLKIKRPFKDRDNKCLFESNKNIFSGIANLGKSTHSIPIRRQRMGIYEKENGSNYISRRKEFLLVQIT